MLSCTFRLTILSLTAYKAGDLVIGVSSVIAHGEEFPFICYGS